MPETYDDIPGTYVYDGRNARRGYKLSKMTMSLAKKENREAFLRDEDAYIDRYGLTPEQRAAVKARDYKKMIALGGNIYYVFKLTALNAGMKMSELGASQAGLPHEAFLEKIRKEIA
jgi:protocatechuate 4,5-dioxygenase alpha chain